MNDLSVRNATEVALSEIKYLDFEKLAENKEAFDSDHLLIESCGVTYFGYTMSKCDMMPTDEEFSKYYELGVMELNDFELKEYANWLLEQNQLCSL